MKRKIILISAVAILGIFSLNVIAQGKEEGDKHTCNMLGPLSGVCILTVEGAYECYSATQDFNCSRS